MTMKYLTLIACLLVSNTHSFSQVPITTTRCNNIRLLSSSSNDDGQSSAKTQEMRMEMSSLKGAKAISKLDINERTKRAMLAESVENRIFEITEVLEVLVKKNSGLLEGEAREEAVELAKQTKALQVQYDDLVSGRPSMLLDLEDERS
eukprot:g3229.t1 g3229   contig12:1665069-1665512(+)